MKAKYTFEAMELDDGLVAVPVGDGAEQLHCVLKVNETAMKILNLLEKETTENAIVEALLKEYTGDKNEISNYVHEYIETLITEGIVE